MFRFSTLGRRMAPQLARAGVATRGIHSARQILSRAQAGRWVAVGATGSAAALCCAPVAFASAEFTEVVACKVGDMKDGEMKEIKVDDEKVLVVRTGGKYYATSGKCTHYGAPLVTGALSENRVVCPWHGASFDVVTGKVQGAPALDNLQSYEVEIRGDDVVVKVPKNKSAADMATLDTDADARLFVIVGGGAAGLACAETLRKEGYRGRLVLISEESLLPYDRTALSKNVKADAEKLVIRNEAYWQKLGVEVRTNTPVINIDAEDKVVTLANYKTLHYDACLVATGARPNIPRVPGHQLSNIFTVRGASESKRIRDALQQSAPKSAVIVGTSFVGLETVTSLKKAGVEKITVVSHESVAMEGSLGVEVGAAMQKLHESNGVSFKMGHGVQEFKGKSGSVSKVVLDNDDEVAADIVIVGTGVTPDSHLVKGVKLDKNGGVHTNSFLRAAPNTYIGGDLASYPDAYSGEHTRVENWNVAQDHGRVAGRNMAGKATTYDAVPFFWTAQQGKSLRCVGNLQGFDEVIVEGSLDKHSFIAYYLKGEQIIGAVGLNAPQGNAIPAIGEAIRTNVMPTARELRLRQVNAADIIKRVAAGCGREDCCQK